LKELIKTLLLLLVVASFALPSTSYSQDEDSTEIESPDEGSDDSSDGGEEDEEGEESSDSY